MAEDPKIHSRKVKVKAVGRLEMLPDNVRKAIKNVEEKSPKTLSGKTPSQLAVDFGHDGLARVLKAYETDTLPLKARIYHFIPDSLIAVLIRKGQKIG